MNLSLCFLLCNFLVSSVFIAVAGENANTKKNVSKKEEKVDTEGIYIDDEVESSGDGENKPDLEASGSGYGPDDEDTVEQHPDSFPGANTKSEKGSVANTFPMPSTTSQSPIPKIETPIGGIERKIQPEDTLRKLSDKETVDANHIDKTPAEDNNRMDNNGGVYMINTPERDRTTSFFAQPGILAAVIGGAVVGLLCAILVVMFIVYRMRKKDEGSYALEEMKRCPATNPYMKPNHREFFA